MKINARIVPLYFDPGRDEYFDKTLESVKPLLGEHVELLDPQPLGSALPEADAVLFPQMIGQAYRCVDAFKAINVPIVVITNQFGTLAMWDWEIIAYLQTHGIQTIAPFDLSQTQAICAALAAKRRLAESAFLVYQDDPGKGFQAPIFKRFYWWEDEAVQRIEDKFGLKVIKKSFRDLGAAAKQIPDSDADKTLADWSVPTQGLTDRAMRSAAKLYLAVKRDLDENPTIGAAGMNCLNESHFSDTTPCLAWSRLYAERGLTWGCEADLVSMVTQYVLHNSLHAPLMMTNLYPFLVGQAALAHERISQFPTVKGSPDDHILVGHCGYFGLIPQAFTPQWTLRRKVLAIVDDNASAIDARFPTGPVTLAKLDPTMQSLSVIEGDLLDYAHFPGSDCLNGGIVHVPNGRKLMERIVSHHYILLVGHHLASIKFVGRVFGLDVETL